MDSINLTVVLAHDPATRTGPHGSFVAVDAFHNLQRRKEDGSYDTVQSTRYKVSAKPESGVGRKLLTLGKGSVISIAASFLAPKMWVPEEPGPLQGVPQLSIGVRPRQVAVVSEKARQSASASTSTGAPSDEQRMRAMFEQMMREREQGTSEPQPEPEPQPAGAATPDDGDAPF